MVFTGGCNLTCPFCHNGELVLNPQAYPDFPLDELLADLEKRQGFIDGVVVSGGEPTIDAGLPAFLAELKQRDFEVKLDSNGLLPEVLETLLERQLVDYYAIDIKTAPARYSELHTHPVNGVNLCRTVGLLKQADVEVEFRTTCVPGLVEAADIEQMGELLRGAPLWVLQQFVAAYAMVDDWQDRQSHSNARLKEFSRSAGTYVGKVELRGL